MTIFEEVKSFARIIGIIHQNNTRARQLSVINLDRRDPNKQGKAVHYVGLTEDPPSIATRIHTNSLASPKTKARAKSTLDNLVRIWSPEEWRIMRTNAAEMPTSLGKVKRDVREAVFMVGYYSVAVHLAIYFEDAKQFLFDFDFSEII